VIAVRHLACLVFLAVGQCAHAAASFYDSPFENRPDVASLTALGRALFSDSSLSASGRMSCASCHDPAHAYGPANRRSIQLGGPDLRQPGIRATPSLMYQQDAPPFSEHFNDTDGDDSIDQGPTGGRDWDGRASSAHEQASGPLLSPFEMANRDSVAVITRLQHSPNASRFRATFGAHVFEHAQLAWNGVLLALEVFQQSPGDFYPYSSKYDAFLRHQAMLSPRELRGLDLFNDARKGNCAQCHPSSIKRGAFPQFTDHGFIAIGVPRNANIPANRNARFHDLGLCGPLRTDLQNRAEYCGLFKTPSLRNVALRTSFFHNGAFHRLEDVLDFYAQRDAYPARFYPRGKDGRVRKFDDLPEAYQVNINTEAPFSSEHGRKPTLTTAESADIIAFLRTLTDGYSLR
jgi:cytochrome c peroxidase